MHGTKFKYYLENNHRGKEKKKTAKAEELEDKKRSTNPMQNVNIPVSSHI